MKVAVTGACGFIGSHLAEMLTEAGHNVTAMTQYNSFDSFGWLDDSPFRKHMDIRRGDVRDVEFVRRTLAKADTVFHLAALVSVPHSFACYRSYFDTNVMGSMNVFAACLETGAKVVHASTSEVYGSARHLPMGIEHPINPQSPYAASKVAADALARSMFLANNLNVVTLRPFNTFGPRQSERAVIPTIIRQCLDPKCEVIKLGNVDAVRDMNFVGDTCDAFIQCAAVDAGEVKTCGSGSSVTISMLADTISEMTTEKKLVTDDRRMRGRAEVTELRADTDFKPKLTLVEGLYTTIKWWEKHLVKARGSAEYIV